MLFLDTAGANSGFLQYLFDSILTLNCRLTGYIDLPVFRFTGENFVIFILKISRKMLESPMLANQNGFPVNETQTPLVQPHT